MSRKRSEAAIEAYHRALRRRRGGARHGVDEARAERVWHMIVGLLGLRLPQGPRRGLRPAGLPVDLAARALRAGVPVLAARRAADGLLPARRARPRGPAPRHRGARRPTSTPARSGCTVEAGDGAVRLGLGYVARRAPRDEVAALVRRARRAGGPFGVAGRARGVVAAPAARAVRTLGDLAPRGRAGAGARAPGLVGGLRRAGHRRRRRGGAARGAVAAGRGGPAQRAAEGTQLALPLEAARGARAARARRVGGDAGRLRDDGRDPGRRIRSALLRAGSAPRGAVDGADLEQLRARAPRAGRRPGRGPPAAGTANGIVFMLLEDERGTVNLVVPPRGLRAPPPGGAHRAARGRRGQAGAPPGGGGAINVLVDAHRAARRPRPRRAPRSRTSRRSTCAELERQAEEGEPRRPRPVARRRLPRRRAARHELRPGPGAMTAPGRRAAAGGPRRRGARGRVRSGLPVAVARGRVRAHDVARVHHGLLVLGLAWSRPPSAAAARRRRAAGRRPAARRDRPMVAPRRARASACRSSGWLGRRGRPDVATGWTSPPRRSTAASCSRATARTATRSRASNAVGKVGPDLDVLRPPRPRSSRTRSRRARRGATARCPPAWSPAGARGRRRLRRPSAGR